MPAPVDPASYTRWVQSLPPVDVVAADIPLGIVLITRVPPLEAMPASLPPIDTYGPLVTGCVDTMPLMPDQPTEDCE